MLVCVFACMDVYMRRYGMFVCVCVYMRRYVCVSVCVCVCACVRGELERC